MSETKLTCPVVRDLLPLYADQVVEPETARGVEDHLADCPDCRERLDALRCDLPAVIRPPQEAAGAELVRREKKISTCRAVILTLAAGFVALMLLALYCGLEGPLVKLDPDNIEVTEVETWIERDEEGSHTYLRLAYTFRGRYIGYTHNGTALNEGGIVVIEERAPLFSGAGLKSEYDREEGYACGWMGVEEEIRVIVINGAVVWTAEKGILDRGQG